MNKIITISREFGSGGRELAKRLAEKLNFKYVDEEIIYEVLRKSKYDEKYIEGINLASNDDFPYTISKSFAFYSMPQKQATDVLVLEQKIIKEFAKAGNCVFVGNGADLILNDLDPFNVFVYADMNTKIQKCKERADENEKLTGKEIIKKIKEIDKSRRKHYLLLGSDSWGLKENYDLCVNTTYVTIKSLVPVVGACAEAYFKENLK